MIAIPIHVEYLGRMGIIIRVAAAVYVVQAIAGFAIGLTLPWLRLLGVY